MLVRPVELFIGGNWAKASTGQRIEVISPHTETPVAQVASAGPDDVNAAVEAARAAFDTGPGRGWSPPSASTPSAGWRRPTGSGAQRWPS
jgi:acyl-CoA reductase-like NAD-dependent aldehyde dehydrogenase